MLVAFGIMIVWGLSAHGLHVGAVQSKANEDDQRERNLVIDTVNYYYDRFFDQWAGLGEPDFADFLDVHSLSGHNKIETFKAIRDNWIFCYKYLPEDSKPDLNGVRRMKYGISIVSVTVDDGFAEVRFNLSGKEPAGTVYPYFMSFGLNTFRMKKAEGRWLIYEHDYSGFFYDMIETTYFDYSPDELAHNRITEYGLQLTEWDLDPSCVLDEIVTRAQMKQLRRYSRLRQIIRSMGYRRPYDRIL